MSYYTESQKTISEKIIFATCDAVSRVKLFTLVGADYERDVDYFVVGVKLAGSALIEASLPLSINEWNYNPLTKKLLINVSADPKTLDISLTYRFFFSNAPINAPYDLNTGVEIEWSPILSRVGSIGQQLDNESTGIVLESDSSLDFINNHGFFDDIFDSLIWENQTVKIYSYFPAIPINERVQLFDGVIESKSFSDVKASLKVKDFVYKLRNKVNLGLFSDSDGIILPSILGTAKRRIYGKADYVKCASLDATLEGYSLTGTIEVAPPSLILTGTGTYFLDEVSPSDELIFNINGFEYKIGVESVDSDTQITATKVPDFSANSSAINRSVVPWRKKNRTWHLAGHKLFAPSAEILIVNSSNTFVVNNNSYFFAGDTISVNGQLSAVRRVSGNKIITSTNIIPIPLVGDTVDRRPISNVFLGPRKLIHLRDYTEINTTEAIITLNNLAEFNNQEQRFIDIYFSFINGSRTVATSDVTDLSAILKPRDWIRSSNVSEPDWYEILSVKSQELILRTPFIGSTLAKTAYYKSIEYIDENSLISANCSGMDYLGEWIRTPSNAVRNLILNDAEFASVNESSFTKANADCDYTLSLVIPKDLGQQYPLVRDAITEINESVFGSLYGDSANNISFSILNSTKPETMNEINDDDILSFSVQTNQKIVNEVKINYRQFIDIYSGENAFKTITFNSRFVDKYIGIKSKIEKTICLYDESDANIIAQRMCFFNSLSNSTLNLKTKMNFALTNLNDKVYLSLDRLFKRFSGTDQRKIGIVTGVKRDGFGCEIILTDMGNIYNRTMSFSPATTPSYSSASPDEKIRFGFILDNDTETPDNNSESELGSNLIG